MRSFGRPRVLVVDDEEKIRVACERALVRGGYDVVHSGGGEEAMALLERDSFDAVLLDVRMPGIDGPQLLSRFRRHDPDAPCIVMSAYADFDAVVELLRDGACEFVHKPFDATGIVAAIDRALTTTHLQVDSALLAATQTIFSSLDPDEIIRRVLGVVRSLLSATPAVIVTSPDGAFAHRLDEERVVSTPAPLTEARLHLLDRRDPVVLSAVDDGPVIDLVAPGAAETIVQRLAIGERVLGLLVAARAPGSRRFGDRCLRRIMVLAGLVALALDNARLHAGAREQARKLDEALDRLVAAERIATVARLAAGLGHEIANPASAALAHLEIAQGHLAGGRQAEASEALGRVVAGVQAVLDVSEALGPLGAGRKEAAIDLQEVVEGAVLLASYELRGRAEVRLEIPRILPALYGDPGKLSQVLLNLLLNAAQAIPAGAPDRHRVTVTVEPVGGAILVRVSDTGVGVPPDVAERIFEPGMTSKASAGGHGMGLAVCRWILDEMGGAIRLLAAPRGAVFEVRLPTGAATSPGTPAARG